MSANNPIFSKNKNFDEAAPFDLLKTEHFLPAIKESIKIANIYIDEIASSGEHPTFDNTILALENSSEHLDIASSIYYHLFSAEAGEELESLSEEISGLLAKFSNDLYLNKNLFEKILHVDNNSSGNSKDEQRLIKVYLRKFIRNGADLKEEDKDMLRKIDSDLSALSPYTDPNLNIV